MKLTLDRALAEAILGIDTLWGGDVMNPSGMGRFIADSWFSDEELPTSYSHATAAAVRAAGGLSADEVNRGAIDVYLGAVDLRAALDRRLCGRCLWAASALHRAYVDVDEREG